MDEGCSGGSLSLRELCEGNLEVGGGAPLLGTLEDV